MSYKGYLPIHTERSRSRLLRDRTFDLKGDTGDVEERRRNGGRRKRREEDRSERELSVFVKRDEAGGDG